MPVDKILLVLIILEMSWTEHLPTEFSETVFKKLYQQRRADQISAVKNIRKLSSNDRQESVIKLMAEKVFTIIQDCRATVEASGYIPGISEFPHDEKVRDCLSNILENTALFSEVVLRFPDITEKKLQENNSWDILLQWSIAFCHQVEYLLDKSTIKLLSLVSQELNHTERDPNYFNPYKKVVVNDVKENEGDKIITKEKKKKKSIKRGPRLANLGEL